MAHVPAPSCRNRLLHLNSESASQPDRRVAPALSDPPHTLSAQSGPAVPLPPRCSIAQRTLSKSDFKIARTCDAKLFFRENGYPDAREDDPYLRMLAAGGYMVEARRRRGSRTSSRWSTTAITPPISRRRVDTYRAIG